MAKKLPPMYMVTAYLTNGKVETYGLFHKPTKSEVYSMFASGKPYNIIKYEIEVFLPGE